MWSWCNYVADVGKVLVAGFFFCGPFSVLYKSLVCHWHSPGWLIEDKRYNEKKRKGKELREFHKRKPLVLLARFMSSDLMIALRPTVKAMLT